MSCSRAGVVVLQRQTLPGDGAARRVPLSPWRIVLRACAVATGASFSCFRLKACGECERSILLGPHNELASRILPSRHVAQIRFKLTTLLVEVGKHLRLGGFALAVAGHYGLKVCWRTLELRIELGL